MEDIIFRSAAEHAASLAKKEYSSLELTQAYLEQIERCNGKINAFITLCAEDAIARAKASDQRRAAGDTLSALDGIPVAVKDNICTEGLRTTCASKMLKDHIPPYNATVVEKLYRGGGIIIGKTNMDEFAMGNTGESSYFGAAKNPCDTSLSPGGSSSGSAAAVASHQAPISLGSDTGGSVRLPAAYCSLVGIKPTYSRVSRYGLIAFSSSLEQIGPISTDVRSNAMLLELISGADAHDMTSRDSETPIFIDKNTSLKGKRFGIVRELMDAKISDGVREAFDATVSELLALGADIVDISVPSLPQSLPAYYIISSAEASSNLARFDGVRYTYRSEEAKDLDGLYSISRREGFGDETCRRILLGTFSLSEGYYDEYYRKALTLKSRLISEFGDAFKQCDIILSPTSPDAPQRLGDTTKTDSEIYSLDICCVPANIAGLPALSIPMPHAKFPCGLQLMGRHFCEGELYSAARAIELLGGKK